MPQIEDRIRDALARQARRVDVPADTAERAVAAGRTRLRRRRVTAAAGAAVAVLAVVAGSSWIPSLVAGPEPRVVRQPTTTSSPTPTESRTPTPPPPSVTPTVTGEPPPPPGVTRTREFLAGLPAGEDVGLYSVHGQLHDNGVVVDLPHGDHDFVVGRVEAGWLLLAHSGGFTGAEDYGARYGLLRSDGSFGAILHGSPLGDGISADGSQAVVAAAPARPQAPAQLVVVDTASGRTIWSSEIPAAAQVFGLVDGNVIYQRYVGRGAPEIWTLSPDGTQTLQGRGWLRDAAPVAGLIAYERGRCSVVQSLTDPVSASPAASPQWQGCGRDNARSFSPNGRLKLTSGREVLDLQTGERATFAFSGQGVALSYGVAWAGDDTVLFEVGWPRRAALISCEVVLGGQGGCERVVALTHLEFGDKFWLADAP